MICILNGIDYLIKLLFVLPRIPNKHMKEIGPRE